MRLFICEKPDLANSVYNGLGHTGFSKGSGYAQSGDDIVTWGFGHILELAEPKAYGDQYEKWSADFDKLPLFIPNKYRPKPDAVKQLKIISDLIKRDDVTEIVHCGDPDEEGQILIDEILNYVKNTKPVKRLLIQDLTPAAIKREVANMKPNSEMKGISESGFARSHADWIVGLSLTRAYSTFAHSKLTVGRVQTPMLALIVNRDKQKEGHKASFYYPVKANFDINGQSFTAVPLKGDRITEKAEAEAIAKACNGKEANLSVSKSNKETNPPLPYNLLKLQIDCSKRWGYSPDKVMQITQRLREEYKAITYNRSDCEYLPESMFESRHTILKNIAGYVDLTGVDTNIKSKAFNDANITAHYAIVPTEAKANIRQDDVEARNVYGLIAQRFALQFYPNKKYISYALTFKVGNYIFTQTINQTTDKGWTAVYSEDKDDDSENPEGEATFVPQSGSGSCVKSFVEEKETKPKPYYTMATLLADLSSVSKYVTDEKIKNLLKAKDKDKKGENGGIGTPATRSAIIKRLFDVGYIEEKGGGKNPSIVSTKRGRTFIDLMPKALSEPNLTALWFAKQEQIRDGELSRVDFLKECIEETKDLIRGSEESIKANVEKLSSQMGGDKKPSAAQITWIENLAKRVGKPLPRGYKTSLKVVLAFKEENYDEDAEFAKDIERAKKIAEAKGEKLDPEMLKDRKAVWAYNKANKEFVTYTPSEKQLNWAKSIEAQSKVAIPAEAYKDSKVLSAYIEKNKNVGRVLNMSEKQVENFAKFSNVLDAKKYEKALTLFEKKKGLGLTSDEYEILTTALNAIFASFKSSNGGNSGSKSGGASKGNYSKGKSTWKGAKK